MSGFENIKQELSGQERFYSPLRGKKIKKKECEHVLRVLTTDYSLKKILEVDFLLFLRDIAKPTISI